MRCWWAIPPAGAKWPAYRPPWHGPRGQGGAGGRGDPGDEGRPTNPDGLPQEVFDGIRKAVLDNRSGFYLAFPDVFFGWDIGVPKDESLRYAFWQQGMSGSAWSQYLCVQQFSKRISPPILPNSMCPR
jgi:hypothetical protein